MLTTPVARLGALAASSRRRLEIERRQRFADRVAVSRQLADAELRGPATFAFLRQAAVPATAAAPSARRPTDAA